MFSGRQTLLLTSLGGLETTSVWPNFFQVVTKSRLLFKIICKNISIVPGKSRLVGLLPLPRFIATSLVFVPSNASVASERLTRIWSCSKTYVWSVSQPDFWKSAVETAFNYCFPSVFKAFPFEPLNGSWSYLLTVLNRCPILSISCTNHDKAPIVTNLLTTKYDRTLFDTDFETTKIAFLLLPQSTVYIYIIYL